MDVIIFTLIVTHLTIISVTLYLHRCQAHRGVQFHPVLEHFFRFWLWLTTGMTTKQWVAIHRKHHQITDKEGDPHSPHVYGIWKLLFSGWYLYNQAAQDQNFVNQYGKGTPSDWIENKLYTPFHKIGLIIMLVLDILIFGWIGLLVWIIQMVWIPFLAAGVINGIGHYWGYRNGSTNDHSRNIFPFGLLIGGEELHNNHHLDPANPKLSRRWFEFDMGWIYIRIFSFFKLAIINKS